MLQSDVRLTPRPMPARVVAVRAVAGRWSAAESRVVNAIVRQQTVQRNSSPSLSVPRILATMILTAAQRE